MMIRATATLLVLMVATPACVPRVEVDSNPCPCAAGWRCCAGDDVCVPEGDLCPDGSGPVADDELVINGEVCTSTAAELLFPVKVVLVIDSSSSMMFNDPSDMNTTTVMSGSTPSFTQIARPTCIQSCTAAGTPAASCQSICSNPQNPARQAAAQALVTKYKDNPTVSFAIVRFNARLTINGGVATTAGFTRDTATLTKAITGLSQADRLSDYESALRATHGIIEDDMKGVDATVRSRTKYVVMFFSDGGIGPECKQGCNNDHIDLGGVVVDSWCDVDRADWCQNFFITNSTHCKDVTSWYPYMEKPCEEYNTKTAILKRVEEIAKLGDLYGAGGVSFNTTYLSVPSLPKEIQALLGTQFSSDTTCNDDKDCSMITTGEKCTLVPSLKQKLCKAPPERLLIDMAQAGNGSYKRFNSGDKIDFLLFDYSSLFRSFGMTTLIATNVNVRPDPSGPIPDTDGDGLADELEYSANLNMHADSVDSDNDGYGDLLEYTLRDQGYDPGAASKPQTACPLTDQVDSDGDGLNACEEGVLGTDVDKPDTDGDRIPDGLELAWGTNPLTADDKTDLDFDGIFSGEEIKAHTDPRVADASAYSKYGYTYSIKQLPNSAGDNQCFGFTIRGVRLVTTLATAGAGSMGQNHILIHFGEAPTDMAQDPGNFKVACVRAQYVKGDGDLPFKDPADSMVKLKADDFVSPKKLLDDLARAKADPKADPCRGARLP